MTALLPPRKRRYRFPLTPLADAMFQLLVFFMLASHLAPYSLLPISGAEAGRSDLRGAPAAGPALVPGSLVIWRLEAGHLASGGRRMALSRLPELLAALRRQSVAEVVLMLGESAKVQDLAEVLEHFGTGGIARLRVVGGG